MKFREKIYRFMQGRNGFDRLCSALIWTALALSILNILFRSFIISIIGDLMLIYSFWRALSRNIYRRSAENSRFISLLTAFKGWFRLQRNRFRDRKTHIYRVCPECKSNLRLPKTKGTHTVRCPRCNARFDVKA